jgi:glycosyltransferase involved in cell wall biosynthesis
LKKQSKANKVYLVSSGFTLLFFWSNVVVIGKSSWSFFPLRMSKIFIGIPTLNRPDYVKETILSVLEQSYQDFVIYVSDNVSTPETQESVRRYVEQLNDPRVTFTQQPYNGGEYGQGWYFFNQAKGYDYFIILHDDDRILPGYISQAVNRLKQHPELAYFVANPCIMDIDGKRSATMTRGYLERHARKKTTEGVIDVLETHISNDFTPISATVFRYNALEKSGFVDDDCYGLFPFESNIYLRLGDINAKAWFSPQELVAFRFHSGAMRNREMLGNFHVLENLICVHEKRRYQGVIERNRIQSLSRLYREKAVYYVKTCQVNLAAKEIMRAFKTYPMSPRTILGILLVGIARLFPALAKSCLSELGPQFTEQEVDDFRRVLGGGKPTVNESNAR